MACACGCAADDVFCEAYGTNPAEWGCEGRRLLGLARGGLRTGTKLQKETAMEQCPQLVDALRQRDEARAVLSDFLAHGNPSKPEAPEVPSGPKGCAPRDLSNGPMWCDAVSRDPLHGTPCGQCLTCRARKALGT